ncbi:very short patch repair endonuclease [Candidatus Saccharibacteria bacterium]|nr:very short patch repair endonuclease [Candidatus Saccharibacteria bacterium]
MDNLTKEQRHKNMQRIRSRDTIIEVKLRRALWHEGIRYRKNYKNLPGKPDIAITKYKIAIFCDSSFFHGRDFKTKKKPATNADYWNEKIQKNIERDREIERSLKALGWTVIRFWDDDINKHLDECIQAVKEVIIEQRISRID